ncbi:hypothetical protein [Mesorhizobium sp. BR1-1-14]|uniref:hypothetical protein n=1 Tax=Mesorhizobium sp. BR1-1-14 TaxID=2876655 RepID=UPI001CD12450|nr:hypothetical protein [Mesorhizobium sp. BR1-1-14]MBZ9960621.1 hypothetical protein [Mesorhizobium sp. BR1-1-14]
MRLYTFVLSLCLISGPTEAADPVSIRPDPIWFALSGTASKDDFISGMKKVLPDLLVGAQDEGIKLRLSEAVNGLSEKVFAELPYAGDGGILILTRVQSYRTEAGVQSDLISNGVEYVGLGQTPADADLARGQDSRLGSQTGKPMNENWRLDTEKSSAVWIKRLDDGSVKVSTEPLSWHNRAVMRTFADRKLKNYSQKLARELELNRLAREAELNIEKKDVAKLIGELRTNRLESIKKRDQIEATLQRELLRAKQAAENVAAIQMFITALSGAKALIQASSALSDADKSTLLSKQSSGEIADALLDMESESKDEAEYLEKEATKNSVLLDSQTSELESNLRSNNVPIDNIPN